MYRIQNRSSKYSLMTPRELESLLQRFVDGRLDDEAIEELTVDQVTISGPL